MENTENCKVNEESTSHKRNLESYLFGEILPCKFCWSLLENIVSWVPLFEWGTTLFLTPRVNFDNLTFILINFYFLEKINHDIHFISMF